MMKDLVLDWPNLMFLKGYSFKNYYNAKCIIEFKRINHAADVHQFMSDKLIEIKHLNKRVRLLLTACIQVSIFVCALTSLFTRPAVAVSLAEENLKNISISICDDVNEWPPYIFFERVEGKKSDKVVGFSIDVLEDIFSRHQIRYTIAMVPWARCMLEVKSGVKYQMVLDFTTSPEREIDYWISQAYYTTNTYYYFSRKKYPQGLPIKAMADLKRYRICGIHGYNVNYAGYIGFFKPGEIDQGTKDFDALIEKIHLQRCDLFLEQYQAMQGYTLIGKPFLNDPELGREPMPGLAPSPFHFAISRQFPYGEKLMTLIDQELKRMESTGRLKELWKKRVPK